MRAPLRIGTDLSEAPQMLQVILERAIADIDGADIAPLSEDGSFDAVLTCRYTPDESLVRSGRTSRLVNVTRGGDVLHIVEKSGKTRRLAYASQDMVIDALTGRTAPVHRSVLGRLWRWLSGPVGASPAPASPHVATKRAHRLAPLNAWLADTVLKNHRFEPSDPGRDTLQAIGTQAGRHREAPDSPGLDRLSEVFGLTRAERDLLLASALAEASPEAARLMGLLGGKAGLHRVSLANTADLGHDIADVLDRTSPNDPLLGFGLVSLVGDGPLVSRELALPADVVGMVLGEFDLVQTKSFPLPGDIEKVPKAMTAEIDRLCTELLSCDAEGSKAVIVAGPADSGRRDVAEAVAGCMKRRAVAAALSGLKDAATRNELRRAVAVTDAALILDVTDAIPSRTDLSALLHGLSAPVLLLAGPDDYAGLASALERPAYPLHLQPRSTADREEHWRHVLPGVPADSLTHVAERFDLGRNGVEKAARLAMLSARAEGQTTPGKADLLKACDQLRAVRFEGAAERLPCRFRRSDIVLDTETSTELDLAITWAAHGRRLFSDGGEAGRLRAGEGLSCMFFGPPGTGKTMAAQIIAREIDYALYRIDLSQVFDKFIGESEKKLAALFDEAERTRVALFFDEADSCFGKRTEVRDSHDRYANMGTNFLLQRLESFTGLAILATNFASNIDDAFVRRIRVRAKFNPPGPEERREIWKLLLPPEPDLADDVDIDLLAGPFEIVGGEIRNAIYTAHLLAAAEGEPVLMRHCVRGLWRELGKIGRLTDRARFGKWQEVI